MVQKKLLKVKEGIDSFINLAVIFLMFALVMVVFFQVFSRYALNTPLTWSEEMARYLFIWIVFLSSVVVFREKKHMGVDFVISLFSHHTRAKIKILTDILIAAFMILILSVSPQIIKITFRQTSPTLSLPMGIIYLSFPVSLALMLLEMIFRVILGQNNKENR